MLVKRQIFCEFRNYLSQSAKFAKKFLEKEMKYLKQFTIIIGVTFFAEILAALIPAPIPASIYGLVIMFLAFYFKIIKIAWVRETASFFIEIMPVIFIPAGAAILVAGDLLLANLAPFIVISLVSTIAVIAGCGVTTQYFYDRSIKKAKEKLYKKSENSHENSNSNSHENLANLQDENAKTSQKDEK